MDQFEFFFTVYSLLLGLALAELMLGYANLLRSPVRPAWGLLTPALSLLIFVEIMITFLDAWLKLQNVPLNLLGLLPPTLIAICFFVAAVMAVPRNSTDWKTLDDYFHDRKKWLLGLLAAQLLVGILAVELPIILAAVATQGWTGARTHWVLINLVIVGLHLLPLLGRNRWLNLGPILLLLAILFYYYGSFTTPQLIPVPQGQAAPA